MNVDLKNPGSPAVRLGEALAPAERDAARERWAPFVDRVHPVVAEAGNDLLYSSFCEGALAAVRDHGGPSEAPVAPVVWTDIAGSLDVAARYDAAAVHPPWNLVADTPFAGEPYAQSGATARRFGVPPVVVDAPAVDIVTRDHDMGLAVNVWPVETWRHVSALADRGTDALIADYPGLLALHRA